MEKIILASQSPRRRLLLEQGGYEFDVIKSNADEVSDEKNPAQYVMELSRIKALDVAALLKEDVRYSCDKYIVLGADTVVSIDDKILGKPENEEDAACMLSSLQGRGHEVFTGVTLVTSEGKQVSFYECTRVNFYPMTQEEIRDYLGKKDWTDKAGGYGIQGPCAIYIKGIEGDYNNVVGLPLARVYQEIKKL